MIRSLVTRLAVVAALVAAFIPAADAPAAVAAADPVPNTSVRLNIADFHQLVLDEAHSRLFIRATDEVLVTDLSGDRIRTIGNVPGNGLMTLSEDGSIMWVALYAEHQILRIRTEDLTKAGRINLPDTICPYSIAETVGKLAVGHRCFPDQGFGVVDLSDESYTESTYSKYPNGAPLVVSSQGAPGVVVATDLDTWPSTLHVFDVTGSEPEWLRRRTGGTHLHDVAFHPDGSRFVQAADDPSGFTANWVSDLSKAKVYSTESETNASLAVAWSGDGSVLAGAAATNPQDVWVYGQGAKQAKVTHITIGDATARGIAVDHTGRFVWAVTLTENGRYWLSVLPGLGWGKCKGQFPNFVGTDRNDVIDGTRHDDVILAGDGKDVIRGLQGDDTICGQAGDDTIHPGEGDDLVNGGGGRDTLSFAEANVPEGVTVDLSARVASGEGSDTVQNIENVTGSNADDIIVGNGKANVIRGGTGHDSIAGLGKSDTIYGEGWQDYIEGGAGNDWIHGGPDDDLLVGDSGHDTLIGWEGDDTLAGVDGNDTLKGGAGYDTASFALSPNGVTVSLRTGTATGEGSDDLSTIEWVVGTEHDDQITGNDLRNLIESRGGDDNLDGWNGDDTLAGGTGTDSLTGGGGYDYCLDGESHSSCEVIDTTAAAMEIPWSLDVLGDAVVFMPRTRLE